MSSLASPQPVTWPALAWSCAVLMGVVAPVTALTFIAFGPSAPLQAAALGPILAIGLMGTGMIAAAADGRFSIGVFLGVAIGAGLLVLALILGPLAQAHFPAIAFAVLVASISFAARGALFARSMPGKGWGMAVFVVTGEAAIILTALAQPGALPDWLLALLPAQWANSAIQAAFTGTGIFAAWAPLLALSGTALATLLAARLLPKRWPYLVMFTTWLSLSVLVYQQN